jgi:hypothetical protein
MSMKVDGDIDLDGGHADQAVVAELAAVGVGWLDQSTSNETVPLGDSATTTAVCALALGSATITVPPVHDPLGPHDGSSR